MGCCHSIPPILEEANEMQKVGSFTETINSLHPSQRRPTSSTKSYRKQPEPTPQTSTPPKLSRASNSEKSKSKSKRTDDSNHSLTPALTPATPASDDSIHSDINNLTSSALELKKTKSELTSFQIKIQNKKTELMRERQKLKELQNNAFVRQLTAHKDNNFERLYDVWQQYAIHDEDEYDSKMDIHGLTNALKTFGMIIDTDRDFQKHIFEKFDIDNEKAITYNDFSATIASFVGSNTDDNSLQTLFEIFDLDNDGYLEIEEMARILLCQNQIAVVVTGGQKSKTTTVYTKEQTLKQARRMVVEYDSEQFQDNKISFNEFQEMMGRRTESDMMIDHMQHPSISIHGSLSTVHDERHSIFVPNE